MLCSVLCGIWLIKYHVVVLWGDSQMNELSDLFVKRN
jgi:hypothetical protein